MNIEYEYKFGLPQALVWKYIKDETVLRNSFPECKSFVEKPGGVYLAEVGMGFGPLKDPVVLEIIRTKEKSPSYYHLSINGKGKLGELSGNAKIYIKDLRGASAVKISADVEVTGKAAFIGKRMLEGSSKKTIEKFFETMEMEMKKQIHRQKKGIR